MNSVLLRTSSALFLTAALTGAAFAQPPNQPGHQSPKPGSNTDINYIGVPVPFATMMTIRAIAALPTLGLAIAAKHRLPPAMAAFSAFALAALYLLLFSPRTEGGGYAGLSLVAAPLAVVPHVQVRGYSPYAGLVSGHVPTMIRGAGTIKSAADTCRESRWCGRSPCSRAGTPGPAARTRRPCRRPGSRAGG